MRRPGPLEGCCLGGSALGAEEVDEAINRNVAAFAETWTYVDAVPVRATHLHWRIEIGLDRASAESAVSSASFERAQETPISVGDLERARALLDDGVDLFARFTGSIDESTDLRGRIEGAPKP